jgi:glutathione S-transferase
MPRTVSVSHHIPDLALYGHPASGHSYKVALFLSLAQTAFRYREVDIFAPPGSRSRAFQAVSRFNEVPVLVVSGRAMCQSNAILLWLAERRRRFGGDTPIETAKITEWLFWEISRLSAGVANLRFLLKFEPNPDAGLIDHYRTRSTDALEELDRALESEDFIAGNRMSIADISCCGYLYWLHEAEIDIGRYANVAAWLARISAVPGWKSPAALLSPGR